MSETAPAKRHGRRARRLTPEEAEAQAARAGAATTDELSKVPPVRGAVGIPTADSPKPALRKFGKRARIIEVSELDAPETQPTTAPQTEDAPPADAATGEDAQAGAADRELAAKAEPWTSAEPLADGETSTEARAESESPSGATEPSSGSSSQTATEVIERDADGVELGEMSVSEAPDPRPAPRFEGQVLHRAEKETSRSLLWLIWAVVAVTVIVLIVLLATGVIGPAAAASAMQELPGTLDPSALTLL